MQWKAQDKHVFMLHSWIVIFIHLMDHLQFVCACSSICIVQCIERLFKIKRFKALGEVRIQIHTWRKLQELKDGKSRQHTSKKVDQDVLQIIGRRLERRFICPYLLYIPTVSV